MDSLQQLVEQLALVAANGTSSPSTTFNQHGPLNFVISTIRMLFSATALREWAILLVIGSLFETARRLLASLWSTLTNAFFVTAVFEEGDISYQWIMHWLSKQSSWRGARNVQISTSNFGLHAVQIEWEEEEEDNHPRKVTYIPAVSESYTLWYKYRWVRISRTVSAPSGGYSKGVLTMSILTRNHGILAEILRDAKKRYLTAQGDKITVYISQKNDYWRELATRPMRPVNSIILDQGIAELVVDDVRDFLGSKEWYADRGIPFRRGYLFYGTPGSGKTSLIQSIAGELGLNVYIISLSRSGLDDTDLAELVADLPEKCIALMEDIDAAFHHGVNRDLSRASSTETSNEPEQQSDVQPDDRTPFTECRVTLSGILNALDGIGAHEGRVLFATTNRYTSLDPALCRPGRMDLHVEFKHASRYQAEKLFQRFYAPSSSASMRRTGRKNDNSSEKHENGCINGDIGLDSPAGDLIDLSESQSQTERPTAPSSTASSPHSDCPSPPKTEQHEESTANGLEVRPTYVGLKHTMRAPALSHDRLNALAAQFALTVPERQVSMASLQGFLMMYKTRPFEAVTNIEAWVKKELAGRKGKKWS